MRTVLTFLLIILSGCASTPKALNAITDAQIRILYEVLADDMRRGDLRSMSKHYSSQYVLEDEVSRPSNPVRWDLVEYFKQGLRLVSSARSYTIEYNIQSIKIDDSGKEAIVVSQHHNRWNFRNHVTETVSVQESDVALVEGRILVSKTKVISSRLL